MKSLLLAVCLILIPKGASAKDVFVKGYFKSNGGYVQSHHRSSPDNTVYNNYEYQNNANEIKRQARKQEESDYGFKTTLELDDLWQ